MKEDDLQIKNRLSACRDEIDSIDHQILSLLAKRQGIASEVGNLKRQKGLGIFNTAREEEIFRRLTLNTTDYLSKQNIRHIFSEIISAARSVQQTINVAYLGPEATFSHQAGIYIFGHSTNFRAAETIDDVFSLVEKGICQQGIVPVENSYEGSISRTMDLFYHYDLKITAEAFMRIRNHLMSKSEKTDQIQRIYSHPMPIAQCRAWLAAHMPGIPLMNVQSTSLAAKMASEDPHAAAIGSRMASGTYGLNILVENIEDQPDNITRFLVINKEEAGYPTKKDRTSLLFFLNHKPGALFHAIEPFANMEINLTRIESRPMKIRNWEYLFFVDIEGHQSDARVSDAIQLMEKHCAILKRLGSYPIGSTIWD